MSDSNVAPTTPAQALHDLVAKMTGRKTTEIRVVQLEEREAFEVILVRGRRKAKLDRVFGREFVDDYPATRESPGRLAAEVQRGLARLLLPREERCAGILMSLEHHQVEQPGELISGFELRVSYESFTRGDELDEGDLFYLYEKGYIDFYHRDEVLTSVWTRGASGETIDELDSRRFKGPLAIDTVAARILSAGQDWLDERQATARQVPGKVYEVFISGCQDELENERLAAREAIEEQEELRRCFRVVTFEDDLSPSSGSAQSETEEAVRRCDVYIGLFGMRYGDVGSDNLSPTEREYRAARKDAEQRPDKGIWIFRHARVEGREEPRLKGLLTALADPKSGHIYKTFRNYKELKLMIQQRLRRHLEEQDRVGRE